VQIWVSISNSSGLEQVRAQFLTVFHKTLRTARERGRCSKCPFFSFAFVVDIFFHGSSQTYELN